MRRNVRVQERHKRPRDAGPAAAAALRAAWERRYDTAGRVSRLRDCVIEWPL